MDPTLSQAIEQIEAGTCGVYAIYHSGSPTKAYIGSSKCVKKRLRQHRAKLRSGKHRNYRLRGLFKVFGENELRVKVLETHDCEFKARRREQHFLDTIPRERLYNIDFQVYNQHEK